MGYAEDAMAELHGGSSFIDRTPPRHPSLQAIAARINDNAHKHGFWEQDNYPTLGDKIALIHSELSEALECYRNHEAWYWEDEGKPEGIGVELLDAAIRILDTIKELAPSSFNIDYAMELKMRYNESRPYKHGGKAL